MINDCEIGEQEGGNDEKSLLDSQHSSGVSRRMIEQFFTEIEGPDRDWQQYELISVKEDRYSLIIEN